MNKEINGEIGAIYQQMYTTYLFDEWCHLVTIDLNYFFFNLIIKWNLKKPFNQPYSNQSKTSPTPHKMMVKMLHGFWLEV